MSIGLPKGHTITLPVTGLSWPIPTFLPPASCRHPMGSATQQAANQKRAVNIIGLTRSIVWATGAAGGLEPTSKLLNQRAPNRHSWVHFFECHDIALPGNATEYV